MTHPHPIDTLCQSAANEIVGHLVREDWLDGNEPDLDKLYQEIRDIIFAEAKHCPSTKPLTTSKRNHIVVDEYGDGYVR